ncbi:hypothetical protein [Paraburkholderia bannensis]|uniref:hypothetical protein n=1 Tax=Paraburkholderia bannensis TaxID=765414 RepID=UPI002ABD5422|nr:hypothetical protein [Paraburkholderia bannensis]
MNEQIRYKHEKKYRIRNETVNRIQAVLQAASKEILYSSSEPRTNSERDIGFTTKNIIDGIEVKVEIVFRVSKDLIHDVTLTLLDGPKGFNELNLKYYALRLMDDIISGEHNGDYNKYTIRTYSKIFNAHPLREEVLVNADYKFLIKPFPWGSKNEPLTEQIVLLDTEVEAINIEHARSLAYNHTSNANAYLSVLLDTGFEMVNSEFRIFAIKQGQEFSLNRYRTGFVDFELGLVVKDNHYGLKDIKNLDHVNSFHSGKLVLNFPIDQDDGGLEFHTTQTIDTISNNDFLEDLFYNHKIIRKNDNKNKPKYISISENPHHPNQEISIPSDIRRYFKRISSLFAEKKEAFLSSCRLYNIALTSGRNQPTLSQSYKVCAVEALANFEKISFSEFMIKYSKKDFDKQLCDYFYSVRSGHFHAGRFYFDEYAVNFQREVALTFQEKTADHENFSRYVRIAIINWIRNEILSE